MLPCRGQRLRGSATTWRSVFFPRRRLSSQPSPPQTIFSGIQPSGVPHLGNYLGALSQWVKLQNESPPDTNLLFSLVDLHAITVPQPPSDLRHNKLHSLATLLALGLDPSRCTIFHQSDVPAHAELMWILSCQASTGYLARMTQWKDKTDSVTLDNSSPKHKLGLFSYPVLQAADILVHRATHVPVGHDQAQHLEFARVLAASFNHAFATDALVPPQTLISPARRVRSLTQPTAKMSKSARNPNSRILLSDSEVEVREKIRIAVTDSGTRSITYDPEARPGISNLIDILFHIDPKPEYADQHALAAALNGMTFKVLKVTVADAVVAHLAPVRERYEVLVKDEGMLEEVARKGAEKAGRSAEETLRKVKEAVGLR